MSTPIAEPERNATKAWPKWAIVTVTALITAFATAIASDIYTALKKRVADALQITSVGLQQTGMKLEIVPKQRRGEDNTFLFWGDVHYITVYSITMTNFDVAATGRIKVDISNNDGFIHDVKCPASLQAKTLDGASVIDWKPTKVPIQSLILTMDCPPPGSQWDVQISLYRTARWVQDGALQINLYHSAGMVVGQPRVVSWF